MPTIYPARHAKRHNAPLVQSPRGMLAAAALKFSAQKKRLFAALVQRRALNAVTCFHATSREEMADIRAYGLDAPVAVIPNGIDVPVLDGGTRPDPAGPRTLLYVGRLHAIKGLDRLLEAWARIEARHPEWRLRIVGPSERAHRIELETVATRLKLARVSFEDALFGNAKLAALQAADLLVLPTLNENFAMIVAEALAAGLPVVATKGAPWAGLVEHRCGWWIDHGVEPLVATLTEAMAMPREALAAMGARGRIWMARDFAWERIAGDMLDVYRWCAGRGDRPDCVSLE
jgi:glycosyltransferase involved in cell wall biosynthesis